MVDERRPHDVTISSEDTITTATITTIEEDDLDLSLSLRPLHYSSTSSPSSHHSKSLPEPSSNAPNNLILSKRGAQALRRREAKLKRDLKRKSSSSASSTVNDVVGIEQPRKVHNLGFQGSPPPWLTWNADCANGGLWPCQGYAGNFASHKEGASISSGSSSGISDNYQCISGPGGHSSDAGSHSSHPHSPLPPTNGPTSATTLLQPCSLQLDLEFNGSNPNHSKPQFCSSYSNKTEVLACSRQPSVSPEGLSSLNMTSQQNGAGPNSEKTLTEKDPNSTPRSTMPKEAKAELGKPPKPVGLIGQQKVLVSEMPCVSTTGNGPNGKTITGFLYKYTKAEVSIICVCHGASFSPAGFVEHAGGVDVEFPLKHIRVVPFALG